MSAPTREENPNGLHIRYQLRKADGSHTAPGSEYLILRVDGGGSDPVHNHACRVAAQAYADAIAHHLPGVAADIRRLYPVLTAPVERPDLRATQVLMYEGKLDYTSANKFVADLNSEVARVKTLLENTPGEVEAAVLRADLDKAAEAMSSGGVPYLLSILSDLKRHGQPAEVKHKRGAYCSYRGGHCDSLECHLDGCVSKANIGVSAGPA